MSERITVIYKKVGKEHEYLKIDNSKEDFEKLVGGRLDYIISNDFILFFNKDSKNMLANMIIYTESHSLGLTLRGNIVGAKINEKRKIVNLDKEIAAKLETLFKLRGLDYTNFDECGRYIKNKKKRKNRLKSNQNISILQAKMEQEKKANNETKLNVISENNNGKLVLERTLDSNTSIDTEDNTINEDMQEKNYIRNKLDDSVLKTILKIQFILLDFIKNELDDSDE